MAATLAINYPLEQSPGGLNASLGQKMSRQTVAGGDIAGPFVLLYRAAQKGTVTREKALSVGGDPNEACIESHIVDAASITVPRRRRRVKTDRIDGETLLRTLMAWKRGEPRVCSMVRMPTREEEDRRRIGRERRMLIAKRVLHVNRVKRLLFCQGIRDCEPLRRDRRARLEELRTGAGRALPRHIKAQISRELDRLELLEQIKTVEAERDSLTVEQMTSTPAPAAVLLGIRGIGPEIAAILHSEGTFRRFDNRREVAAYAGLALSPWHTCSRPQPPC